MNIINTILTYFFEPLPSGRFEYMYTFIVLAIVILTFSIALRLYLKRQKDDKIFRKLFRELPGKLQIISIVLAVYILARYERMPYLSMRFLHYIIWAVMLYLLIKYAKIYFQIYPAEKKHHQKQLELNKYLPRKMGRK